MVRTLACHARGQGFEPPSGRQFPASVAQSVEQGTENPRVVGSIPTGGTNGEYPVFPNIPLFADLAHLVERHLAKVEVAGSSPVIRSILHGHSPFAVSVKLLYRGVSDVPVFKINTAP